MSWLEALKVGDPVVISIDGLFKAGLHAHKVDRLTATQIIIGEWRFRRSDGQRIGGHGWRGADLHEPKPELLARIRRMRLIRFIVGAEKNMELLPLDELENFAGRLNSFKVGNPPG